MLILIAEAKTMRSVDAQGVVDGKDASRPVFDTIATEIMAGLRDLPIDEIAGQTGLSPTLAAKLQKMAYDFPFKTAGYESIEAYTGVVFKALGYDTLSEQAKADCRKCVRIISSLYGWLRPDDIIKPYRLDFNTKLEQGPSDAKAMNVFWRPDVTKALVRYLTDHSCREILNLLPGDASNAIDWKLVKRFAKVYKADFVEFKDGDKPRTPSAGILKTMRGRLLRQLLEENVTEARQILRLESPHYFCEGTPQYPDHFRFIC